MEEIEMCQGEETRIGLRKVPGAWSATVVFVSEENGDIKVGMSLCNPNDHFNKKQGVETATVRAEKSGSWVMNLPFNPVPEYIPYDLYVLWAQEYITQHTDHMKQKQRKAIFDSLDIPEKLMLEEYEQWFDEQQEFILDNHQKGDA